MKDQAAFTFDFLLSEDQKAITETEEGDLLIEGYASDFGEDRHDEAFLPGAWEEAVKAFRSNPVLCFHHKKDFQLGQVLELRPDQKGLWIKARVDKPEPHTQAADIFRKIKRGSMKGFSVGGRFYRQMTPQGPRIHKADLYEVSVTPLPVNPRTLFTVAQKAFADDEPQVSPETEAALGAAIDRLAAALASPSVL